MSVHNRPNMKDFAIEFGNSAVTKLNKLKQELETVKMKRDAARERLEVARITLEKKFEEIGQMEPDIVKMCCKDLLAQCMLLERNVDKLKTDVEVAEYFYLCFSGYGSGFKNIHPGCPAYYYA